MGIGDWGLGIGAYIFLQKNLENIFEGKIGMKAR